MKQPTSPGFRSLMDKRAARRLNQPDLAKGGGTLDEWRASTGAGHIIDRVRPKPGWSLDAMDVFFSIAIQAPMQADLRLYDPELETREETRLAVVRGELDDTAVRPEGVAIERLAFYVSPHRIPPANWIMDDVDAQWGIFITTGGIEHLARDVYLPIGLDLPTAIQAATGALYRHELFHHLVAVAAAAMEDRDRTELYLPFLESTHARSGCSLTEEGLASAFAVRLTQGEEERQALLEWTRTGPPGYRDAAGLLDDHDYRSAGRQLLADLRGVPTAAVGVEDRLLLDMDLREVDPGEVPLHIVESPGSAHEAQVWQWKP